MNIINRKSKEVIVSGNRAVSRSYISIENGQIYFTAAISRICELQVGLFIHFLNEGSDWRFYVNDNPDGFKLTPVISKNGFHITSAGLTNLILKSTGFNKQKRFSVIPTDNYQDKCRIFSLSLENVSNTSR